MILFNESIEIVLKELESTQHQFWNVARESANFLNMMAKITDAKRVLELGTSNGYSAIWLALALSETNGHLTTIEFWDKRQSIAKENFKRCGVENIITCKLGSATDILQHLDSTFDMVFIDANKLEYLKYFELIDPMLEHGGIILADNIISHAEKVKPFIDAVESNENYQTQLLNLPDGMLLARKL